MTNSTVSVKELVEFTFIYEDISPATSIDIMQNGTISHKARQNNLDSNFIVEHPIISYFSYNNIKLTVQGRMDAFYDSISYAIIEEIKLCNPDNPPLLPTDRHMWQGLCYAAMLFNNRNNQEKIKVILNYCSLNGDVCASFSEIVDKHRAQKIISTLVIPYIEFLVENSKLIESRNSSIKSLQFPFEKYRQGQREMAVQVYTAIQIRKKLFASLPTGTGKTIASIFPAVKAMQEGLCNKIFYLTARTSARQAPINAITLLQKSGLNIRTLIITAKEKACIHDMNCDPNNCPYAKGYYIREKDAIKYILDYKIWNFDTIHSVATKYEICPFEFSLSLYYMADIIICDYNYVFDPFVKLIRAEKEQANITVLIDEAHQLLPRLRNSLSAKVDLISITNLDTTISNHLTKKHKLHKLIRKLKSEIKVLADTYSFDSFIVIEALPYEIAYCCNEIKFASAEFFSDNTYKDKSIVLESISELYKCVNQFSFAYEHIQNSYKIILYKENKNIFVELYCIDPRFQILNSINNMAGAIFFSATLNPLQNIKIIMGGTNDDATFSLPSPYPSENLLILRQSISTYYNDRPYTISQIAYNIKEIVLNHMANYIVYLPSYNYMELLHHALDTINVKHILQEHDMSDSNKQKFISSFESNNNILALCVMGGSFAEGIDLPDNLLYGVIIIGVGLQKPDVKSELLKEYFDKKYNLGYEFAYLYPAIHKILQASGRVIRSETDRGIVMLIDKRYYTKRYTNLLPKEWRFVDNNYINAINEFNK